MNTTKTTTMSDSVRVPSDPTEAMTKAACERYHRVQKERGVHSPAPVSYSDMRSALYAAIAAAPAPAADVREAVLEEVRAAIGSMTLKTFDAIDPASCEAGFHMGKNGALRIIDRLAEKSALASRPAMDEDARNLITALAHQIRSQNDKNGCDPFIADAIDRLEKVAKANLRPAMDEARLREALDKAWADFIGQRATVQVTSKDLYGIALAAMRAVAGG